ncbi:MAG TPA: hypothetical protein VGQ83_09685 [Polyangia bacterium]|jgi:hypothetical protein
MEPLRPSRAPWRAVIVILGGVLAACAGEGRAPGPAPQAAMASPARSAEAAPPAAAGAATTIEGVARNAKAGAVVLTAGGEPVYVQGLDAWPRDVDGKTVVATGRLVDKKLIPDPVGPDGELRQGAVGTQRVLEQPAWRVKP